MKVINIKEEQATVYLVNIKPCFIMRLLGSKEKNVRVKDIEETYNFGGGSVYVNEKGEKLGNGNYIGVAIDNWKRKF